MAIGIICIIVGCLFTANAFLIFPSSAPQQTVQYLGFVCASIFLVGGFILIALKKYSDQTNEEQNQNRLFRETFESSDNNKNRRSPLYDKVIVEALRNVPDDERPKKTPEKP